MKNKKALTLAEILITIVIIGTIIMFILPSLRTAMPSNNKIMFKKAYSTLQQAISIMINDDVNYPASSLSGTTLRGFNNTSATINNTKNKFCYLLEENLNTIEGGSDSCILSSATGNTTFTTSDGVSWILYIPISDATTNAISTASDYADNTKSQFPLNPVYYTTKIIVDVNGSKDPNCTNDTVFATYSLTQCPANTVADKYIIGIRYDGKMQVGCSTVATNTLCTTITDQKAVDILDESLSNQ